MVRDLSVCVGSPGTLLLVGSGGAGKSSLLMALAGTAGHEAVLAAGTTRLDGGDVGAGSADTVWLPQHTRLPGWQSAALELEAHYGVAPAIAEGWLREAGADPAQLHSPAGALPPGLSRLLPRLALVARPASLYLLDEPTADLEPSQADLVRRRLRELARRAVVVVATHNRRDCLALGGQTALLAGGTLQECAPTDRFFSRPATPAGRRYVQTGYCNLAPPAASGGGDGIWWVQRGLLGGMSRPGLVGHSERQLRTLSEAGVRMLVCMEEQRAYPLEPLRRHGLAFQHFPVPDMQPPTIDQALALCRLAEAQLAGNRGVAMHCRGGVGRTGVALAAILVWLGDQPGQAVARIRAARPGAIQSPSQLRFVHEFAGRIAGWH